MRVFGGAACKDAAWCFLLVPLGPRVWPVHYKQQNSSRTLLHPSVLFTCVCLTCLSLYRPITDARASKQFLLLAHLYAKTDANSLEFLRAKLLPPNYTALQLGVAAGVTTALAGGGSRDAAAVVQQWLLAAEAGAREGRLGACFASPGATCCIWRLRHSFLARLPCCAVLC